MICSSSLPYSRLKVGKVLARQQQRHFFFIFIFVFSSFFFYTHRAADEEIKPFCVCLSVCVCVWCDDDVKTGR